MKQVGNAFKATEKKAKQLHYHNIPHQSVLVQNDYERSNYQGLFEQFIKCNKLSFVKILPNFIKFHENL